MNHKKIVWYPGYQLSSALLGLFESWRIVAISEWIFFGHDIRFSFFREQLDQLIGKFCFCYNLITLSWNLIGLSKQYVYSGNFYVFVGGCRAILIECSPLCKIHSQGAAREPSCWTMSCLWSVLYLGNPVQRIDSGMFKASRHDVFSACNWLVADLPTPPTYRSPISGRSIDY